MNKTSNTGREKLKGDKVLPFSQYKIWQPKQDQSIQYVHLDGLNAAEMASSSVLVETEIGEPYTSSPSMRRFALTNHTVYIQVNSLSSDKILMCLLVFILLNSLLVFLSLCSNKPHSVHTG